MNNKIYVIGLDTKDIDIELENNNDLPDDFYKLNINNIFLNDDNEKVLCVGQVQSGKTQNIINLIRESFNEYDYDFVIFFAGITNLLLNQTINRIEKEFYECDSVKILSSNFFKLETYLNSNKKVIITLLKGTDAINQLFKSINQLYLTNKKILIIDDECDYASLNIKKEGASKIYSLINQIFYRTHFCKLVFFTGTPFANILNSKNATLKIDRIVNLINYKKYCGLKRFNNSNCYLNLDVSKNVSNIDELHLEKTIALWLIGTSIALLYDINYKSELLINVYTMNEDQKNIYDKSIPYFKLFYKRLNADDFNDYINNLISNYYSEFDDIKFIDLKDKFKTIIESLCDNNRNNINEKLVLLNNSNVNKYISGKHQFTFIVSGFMASRGFTFENLTTVLFLNAPENKVAIDTLLQRCRWFGNRENRMKYMKIITNQQIINALKKAEDYIDIFVPGVTTMNVDFIKEQIVELDKNNKLVESTNSVKRK